MNKIITRIKKFNRYIDEYLPNQKKIIKLLIFLDFLYALFVHGSTIKDYFVYEFYKKSNFERNEYITEKRLSKIVKYFNREPKISFIRDKVTFNLRFSKYINRDWLDPSTATLDEFTNFVKNNDEIIVKPRYGHGGKGIQLLNMEDIEEDYKYHFEKLSKGNVILEEKLQQGGVLGNLNPSSVNTIRLVVLNTGDSIEFISAVLRMGNGNSITDNVSNEETRGLAAQIDIKSGIVFLPAKDIKGDNYIYHPISKIKIVGIRVPEWEKILSQIRMIAESIPEVRYTGWDIAVCEGGKIAIIEGNTYVGGYSQQVSDQVGKWKIYKGYMR